MNGAAYHLTHRCHDRAYLLATESERDAYRERLRKQLHKSPVSLLSYTITSNHGHLLVASESSEAIATLMRRVQGEHAADYNQRKGRSGAFWSDRYHATMIDDGEHLMACLRYIDLNMVRAGVVSHPRDWSWTGWHELVGERKRYRLIDTVALLRRLPGQGIDQFRACYRAMIDQALTRGIYSTRESGWTESLAVGSTTFVQRIEAALASEDQRRRMTRACIAPETWQLREGRANWLETPESTHDETLTAPITTISGANTW